MALRLLSIRVTISVRGVLPKWASVSFTGRPSARATIASASLRSITRPPPCQHVVEKAVSRVVILLAVAAKPFLLEEEHPESVERPPSPEGTRAGARGEVVEPAEPGPGLELGILDAGDRQGGPTQVDLPVGPPKELAELVEWVSSQGRGGFRP